MISNRRHNEALSDHALIVKNKNSLIKQLEAKIVSLQKDNEILTKENAGLKVKQKGKFHLRPETDGLNLYIVIYERSAEDSELKQIGATRTWEAAHGFVKAYLTGGVDLNEKGAPVKAK